MVVVMLAQASLAVTTTPRSPSRCRPHRGERMVESTRAGEHARVVCLRVAHARVLSLCPFTSTPHRTTHHTTPHHITSHHTTLSCVPSSPRCGRRRERDLALWPVRVCLCGSGCGCTCCVVVTTVWFVATNTRAVFVVHARARARARAVLMLSTTHFLIPYNPGASRWL